MTIRNTVEADLDTILALIEQQKSVNTVNVPLYHDHVAGGMYRDAWNWVVEEDGKIQALAIWWGRPGDDHPYSIDGLYFAGDGDPVPAWTALIRRRSRGVRTRSSSRSTTSSSRRTGRTTRRRSPHSSRARRRPPQRG